MTEHAPTVFKEPSLSHIHPVDNTLILSTVPEVKASNRMRSNAAATKGSSTQASSLVRSKSACAIPGQPKATSLGHARGFTPSAPPPKVHPLEPVGRPTSLRRPPKLGFFDVVCFFFLLYYCRRDRVDVNSHAWCIKLSFDRPNKDHRSFYVY